MIEKGKDMITIPGNSLLKSYQLFVLWIQRFGQQIIQLFFQKRAKMVWVIVIGRSKLLFKFMCLPEHGPESDRPGYLVTLLQIFGFSFQVSSAQLVCLYRGLKVRFPAIMNKYSFLRYAAHIFNNRSCSPVGRRGNKSSTIVLPCPEPMIFPIDFYSRFVCTDNLTMQYSLPDHFVGINTFRCQSVHQPMQATFTNLNRKDVIHHFLKSFERKILSDTKITNDSFNAFPISDRTINTSRKVTLYNLPTGTRAPINPVFCYNLFDRGDFNYLSLPGKLERKFTHIFSTFRTKTRMMFNNLIGGFCHLQRLPFMPVLSSCFTITFLSKTARAWWPVLI